MDTFTISELEQMSQITQGYSSIDSMPAPCMTAARGVKLTDILTKAGVNVSTVQKLTFKSTDDYITTVTKQYLLDTERYYYPNLTTCFNSGTYPAFSAGADEGKVQVQPVMALVSYYKRFDTAPAFNNMDGLNTLRLCFGQSSPSELTSNKFAKWVNEIDVDGSLLPVATPPTLTADTTDNKLGQPIEITFTDDGAWRGAITEVNVGETVLESDQYAREESKITLDADVFAAAGTYTIVIKAAGYSDAAVDQVIESAAAVEPDLIIDGPKVAQVKEYTVADLKKLEKDTSWPPAVTDKKPVIQSKYSAVDSANRNCKYSAEGVRVKYLLEQSGVQPGYGKIIFHSSDGWKTPLTEEEINETRYYFPVDPAGDAIAVEPILAYQSGKWVNEEPDLSQMWAEAPLRLFLGQKTTDEAINNNFAKKVIRMEVGEEAASPEPAVYTITPAEDATYTRGTTSDGISTMTVNTGASGINYFSVGIAPVTAHQGLETAVFVHLRNGVQLSINATMADFDTVQTAQAGFNVKPGDIVKAYIVNELTNAEGVNPIVYQ